MPLIEVQDVTRTFVVRRRARRLRRERFVVRAVDRISFTVEAGEMVGYIGPNGAGKSTTVKMLTGILVPTAGRLRRARSDDSSGTAGAKDRGRLRAAHDIVVGSPAA
jgi:ABC-2 type transport system ATP-binding protein